MTSAQTTSALTAASVALHGKHSSSPATRAMFACASSPPGKVRDWVRPPGGPLLQVPRGRGAVQERQGHRLHLWLVPGPVWCVQGGALGGEPTLWEARAARRR